MRPAWYAQRPGDVKPNPAKEATRRLRIFTAEGAKDAEENLILSVLCGNQSCFTSSTSAEIFTSSLTATPPVSSS